MTHEHIIIPNDQTPLEGNNNQWSNFFVNSFVNYIRKNGHISPERGNIFITFEPNDKPGGFKAVLSNETRNMPELLQELNDFVNQSKETMRTNNDGLIIVKYTNCAYKQSERNFFVLVDGQLYFFDF